MKIYAQTLRQFTVPHKNATPSDAVFGANAMFSRLMQNSSLTNFAANAPLAALLVANSGQLNNAALNQYSMMDFQLVKKLDGSTIQFSVTRLKSSFRVANIVIATNLDYPISTLFDLNGTLGMYRETPQVNPITTSPANGINAYPYQRDTSIDNNGSLTSIPVVEITRTPGRPGVTYLANCNRLYSANLPVQKIAVGWTGIFNRVPADVVAILAAAANDTFANRVTIYNDFEIDVNVTQADDGGFADMYAIMASGFTTNAFTSALLATAAPITWLGTNLTGAPANGVQRAAYVKVPEAGDPSQLSSTDTVTYTLNANNVDMVSRIITSINPILPSNV